MLAARQQKGAAGQCDGGRPDRLREEPVHQPVDGARCANIEDGDKSAVAEGGIVGGAVAQPAGSPRLHAEAARQPVAAVAVVAKQRVGCRADGDADRDQGCQDREGCQKAAASVEGLSSVWSAAASVEHLTQRLGGIWLAADA
eukprot:2549777-Prymnesium_polylepis.1